MGFGAGLESFSAFVGALPFERGRTSNEAYFGHKPVGFQSLTLVYEERVRGWSTISSVSGFQ